MRQSTELSAGWQAVGLIIDLNANDHVAGHEGTVEQVVGWFKAVELFRKAEDETMYLKEPTRGALRQHQTSIAALIAQGDQLTRQVRAQGGIPEGVVRFKLADVAATVESLRSDERMWHGSTFSPQRRREILKALFDVEEPGT